MDEREATRQRFLGRASALGICIGAAGCLRVRQAGDGDETTPTDTPGTAPAGSGRPDFDGYLNGATNYDGDVVDARGHADVTVDVSAGDSGIAFSPVAVHVDNGTTIEWEWTGEGGAHNVVAEDGTFDSGSTMSSGTYNYTFEEAGVYQYHCEPHEAIGMKGTVVVGTDYPIR